MSIEAMKQSLKAMKNAKGKIYSDFVAYKEVESAIKVLEEAIAEAEKQEPVAWATAIGKYAHVHWGKARPDYPVRYEIPLYTHPQPKQEPAGDKYTSFGLMGGDKFVNQDSLKRSIT